MNGHDDTDGDMSSKDTDGRINGNDDTGGTEVEQ